MDIFILWVETYPLAPTSEVSDNSPLHENLTFLSEVLKQHYERLLSITKDFSLHRSSTTLLEPHQQFADAESDYTRLTTTYYRTETLNTFFFIKMEEFLIRKRS